MPAPPPRTGSSNGTRRYDSNAALVKQERQRGGRKRKRMGTAALVAVGLAIAAQSLVSVASLHRTGIAVDDVAFLPSRQSQSEKGATETTPYIKDGNEPIIAATELNQSIVVPANVSQKPYFILHVGPPKTATTTIQCDLHRLSGALAEKDSYFYVGKSCPTMGGKLANNETAFRGQKMVYALAAGNANHSTCEDLKSRMMHHHSQRNNIILSTEGFSSKIEDYNQKAWDILTPMLNGWDVIVVVAYRHYFHWIASLYYQQHHGKQFLNWPSQRGSNVPSLQEYIRLHLDNVEKDKVRPDQRSVGKHLSVEAYKKFSKRFRHVAILNLHASDNLIRDFVCNILPTARKVCQDLSDRREDDEAQTVARQSVSLESNRLASAAKAMGLVQAGVPKQRLMARIDKRMEILNSMTLDGYQTCLPTLLENKLLNASLFFENQMVIMQEKSMCGPEFRKDSSHIASFKAAITKGKFCEIDPEKVLADEEWKTFIRSVQ